MRYRLIATYHGAPYQAALGPGGEEVTLFAACPPPEELGFSSAAGHWRKQASIADIDGLRQSRPAGRYHGERCIVLDDQGDRLHIAYLGDDPGQARRLGYWEIDREVFEMVVPRPDVSDLSEEQVDVPAFAVVIPAPPAPAMMSAPPMTPPPMTAPAATAPQRVLPPESPVDPPGYSNGHQTPDRMAAWHGSPEPWVPREASTEDDDGSDGYNGNYGSTQAGPRTARRERIPIQSVFAELLDLAAIPHAAYAVDEEVPGAMCLLKVEGGFEVFASSDDARHEVRFFEDEEAAYFYLFGVLAAEAVRNGNLIPGRPGPAGGPGFSGYAESLENVSKYLRRRNCPYLPRSAVRVLIAGGADGPPLPKQPRRPLSRRYKGR
jgi:hypothetical protein